MTTRLTQKFSNMSLTVNLLIIRLFNFALDMASMLCCDLGHVYLHSFAGSVVQAVFDLFPSAFGSVLVLAGRLRYVFSQLSVLHPI